MTVSVPKKMGGGMIYCNDLKEAGYRRTVYNTVKDFCLCCTQLNFSLFKTMKRTFDIKKSRDYSAIFWCYLQTTKPSHGVL